jgi:ATP-dependent Clp protease ATP-binding subunit ClpA
VVVFGRVFDFSMEMRRNFLIFSRMFHNFPENLSFFVPSITIVLEDMSSNKKESNQKACENLSKFAVDLTALAKQGKLDPVIGRDDEIRRVIGVLARRRKNNPVLIGEPGVGMLGYKCNFI